MKACGRVVRPARHPRGRGVTETGHPWPRVRECGGCTAACLPYRSPDPLGATQDGVSGWDASPAETPPWRVTAPNRCRYDGSAAPAERQRGPSVAPGAREAGGPHPLAARPFPSVRSHPFNARAPRKLEASPSCTRAPERPVPRSGRFARDPGGSRLAQPGPVIGAACASVSLLRARTVTVRRLAMSRVRRVPRMTRERAAILAPGQGRATLAARVRVPVRQA
jgi:hypothetical protein